MHQHNDTASGGDGTGDWQGKRQVSPTLIGLVVIAILTVIFIVGNGDKVDVRLIIPTVELPVWVAIIIALVVGAVLDRLFFGVVAPEAPRQLSAGGAATTERRRRRDN